MKREVRINANLEALVSRGAYGLAELCSEHPHNVGRDVQVGKAIEGALVGVVNWATTTRSNVETASFDVYPYRATKAVIGDIVQRSASLAIGISGSGNAPRFRNVLAETGELENAFIRYNPQAIDVLSAVAHFILTFRARELLVPNEHDVVVWWHWTGKVVVNVVPSHALEVERAEYEARVGAALEFIRRKRRAIGKDVVFGIHGKPTGRV